MNDQYLTPGDYEIAEQNGIDKRNLEQRFYSYSWDKERAITQPLKKSNSGWDEWKDIAKSNGISYGTYLQRVNSYKWSREDAAMTPVITVEEKVKMSVEKTRFFTEEQVRRARANGVSKSLLRGRVKNRKWDIERERSTPPLPVGRQKKQIS